MINSIIMMLATMVIIGAGTLSISFIIKVLIYDYYTLEEALLFAWITAIILASYLSLK